MTTPLHQAQIEQIRRDAKRRSHELNIPLHQAQNEMAAQRGYANWSLMMKHRIPAQAASTIALPLTQPFHFVRSLDEMRVATRRTRIKTPYRDRWQAARERIADINAKFISAANALDFAIDYMNLVLELPRVSVTSESAMYWEMRCWLPYCMHPVRDDADLGAAPQIMVGRHYKPVGYLIDEEGSYVNYAAFPHLHLELTATQIGVITREGCEAGFLYDDGCSPWYSKADARQYLARLQLVRTVVGN